MSTSDLAMLVLLVILTIVFVTIVMGFLGIPREAYSVYLNFAIGMLVLICVIPTTATERIPMK